MGEGFKANSFSVYVQLPNFHCYIIFKGIYVKRSMLKVVPFKVRHITLGLNQYSALENNILTLEQCKVYVFNLNCTHFDS